VQQTFKL